MTYALFGEPAPGQPLTQDEYLRGRPESFSRICFRGEMGKWGIIVGVPIILAFMAGSMYVFFEYGKIFWPDRFTTPTLETYIQLGVFSLSFMVLLERGITLFQNWSYHESHGLLGLEAPSWVLEISGFAHEVNWALLRLRLNKRDFETAQVLYPGFGGNVGELIEVCKGLS